MKYFILVIALFSTPVMADATINLGLFVSEEDNSSGAIVEIAEGNTFLYKGGVVIAKNLSGPTVAIGYRAGPIDLYVGYVRTYRMEDMGPRIVNVGGIGVIDPTGVGSGDATFIEAKYKNLFIRYTGYDVDYRYFATRVENGVVLGGERIINVTDEVFSIGLVFEF